MYSLIKPVALYLYNISGVGRCSLLGGPNFFNDIYLYTYACTCLFFYVCKTHVEIFEVKIVCLCLKTLQKWLECGLKNIFTVKIPSIAPTLPPPPFLLL